MTTVNQSTENTAPALYKAIEYAYPSSDHAKMKGYYDTGCYFVILVEGYNGCIPVQTYLLHSNDKKSIESFADGLPYPYCHVHEKFYIHSTTTHSNGG